VRCVFFCREYHLAFLHCVRRRQVRDIDDQRSQRVRVEANATTHYQPIFGSYWSAFDPAHFATLHPTFGASNNKAYSRANVAAVKSTITSAIFIPK
jgi:hypothetical protein